MNEDTEKRKDVELWVSRAGVVGRAQAQYLWLLLVGLVFYYAVRASTEPTVSIPLFDLKLPPEKVLASGSPVLAFLVLSLIGTARQFKAAFDRAEYSEVVGKDLDCFDQAPNAIDFAFDISEKAQWPYRFVSTLMYPFFATVCLAASILISIEVLLAGGLHHGWMVRILLASGVPLSILAACRLSVWRWNRFARLPRYWHGGF